VNGLLALTSAKHSPGVTTAAVALAIAAGPIPRSLVVEADPAGGALGARGGLTLEPGLSSLAASSRHGTAMELVAHTQPLPAGPSVLLAAMSPALAAGALDSLGARLREALRQWDGTVVVDCGRWVPGGPAGGVIAGADALLVVLRPTLERVEHVRARLDELRAAGAGTLGALLVGDRPYRPAEVEAVLGIPVAGALAYDPRGAQALERRMIGADTMRSTIVRAARSALDRMTDWPCARPAVWA
jgi:MinD-like ATPase involved in chromosome partitioning or flagellar assembly